MTDDPRSHSEEATPDNGADETQDFQDPPSENTTNEGVDSAEALQSNEESPGYEPDTHFAESEHDAAEPTTTDGAAPEDPPQDDPDEDESDDQPPTEEVQQARSKRERLDEQIDNAGQKLERDEKDDRQQRRREFEHRRISVTRVEDSDLRRVRDLYVETPAYKAFVEEAFTANGTRVQDPNRRVWLVAGPPRSGRMMTAMNLALALRETSVDSAQSVWIYSDNRHSLTEIAAEPKLPTNSVILFEGGLNRRDMRLDALFSPIDTLNSELKTRRVRFILVVPDNDPQFPLHELVGNYGICKTDQPDLPEVFRRLVSATFQPESQYEDEIEQLEALIDDVPEAFKAPRRAADISYWFRLHGANAARLETWIRNGEYEQSRESGTNTWFDDLPNLNLKLYAMLVVLLQGLDSDALEEIYEISVSRMREIGLDVPAPEEGSARSGKRLYKSDCRTCHGRKGEGKTRKESPPRRSAEKCWKGGLWPEASR